MSTNNILKGIKEAEALEYVYLHNRDSVCLPYRPYFVQALKAIRASKNPTMSLAETLKFIASEFGFHDGDSASGGWPQFRQWIEARQLSLKPIQGPHALTIMKAMAIKYNVSTQRSE